MADKMFINERDWKDIVKWNEESQLAQKYPHVIQPLYGEADLLVAPSEDTAPRIELAAPVHVATPTGIILPEVLCPVWTWRGKPPILHMEIVGWRAWEDLQVALELERQILTTSRFVGIDWASPLAIKSENLNVEGDYAGLEMRLVGGLAPALERSAPNRLLAPTFDSKS